MDEAGARPLDEVFHDLTRITQLLDEATDPLDRIELNDRLNELRAEAASARGPDVSLLSDAQLADAIRSTQRRLDAIRAQRFDPSMVAGASGRGGGIDPILAAKHNQRVDAAGGRVELEHRLGELLSEHRRRVARS
jgi:hypothetical protein